MQNPLFAERLAKIAAATFCMLASLHSASPFLYRGTFAMKTDAYKTNLQKVCQLFIILPLLVDMTPPPEFLSHSLHVSHGHQLKVKMHCL